MDPDLRPMRAYFIVSSKDGLASLSVDHTWSLEHLTIPVFPSNAVDDCVDLLCPPFAHYVRQWQRYMVDDVYDTMAQGFWIPSDQVSEHIAEPGDWDEITRRAWNHYPPEVKAFFDDKPPEAISIHDPTNIGHGNIDDVVSLPEDFGVHRWSA